MHKKLVVACVITTPRVGEPERIVHSFGTMTKDLLKLGDWLELCGVSHVAMAMACTSCVNRVAGGGLAVPRKLYGDGRIAHLKSMDSQDPSTVGGDTDMSAVSSLGSDASAMDVGQDGVHGVAVTLIVNRAEYRLVMDSRVTLLDALRERLALTGTKKGCDHGACGACTVLVGGRRVLSCLILAATCDERSITTIEGIAGDAGLHPLQEAFLRHDGFQCGFCTPGQIMSAIALIDEGRASSDAEIRDFMSGNICRCGAYPNIVAAIREVAERGSGAAV